MRSRALAAALTVVVLTSLGACSDGEVDPAPAPDPTELSPVAPTSDAADLEEAHALYHALAGELEAAILEELT